MKQMKVNILSPEITSQADVICVTTNQVLRKNGRGIMGAGVAKAFREHYLQQGINLEYALGQVISTSGRADGVLYAGNPVVYSLPTKNHWREKSSLMKITASLLGLEEFCSLKGHSKVFLTRPGCGNGGLSWTDQVKPLCQVILDDRFTVCYL